MIAGRMETPGGKPSQVTWMGPANPPARRTLTCMAHWPPLLSETPVVLAWTALLVSGTQCPTAWKRGMAGPTRRFNRVAHFLDGVICRSVIESRTFLVTGPAGIVAMGSAELNPTARVPAPGPSSAIAITSRPVFWIRGR